MMMILLFLFSFAWADPVMKWMNAVEVVEKHEFYQNNEMITKPRDTWEVLFGVIYRDATLKSLKDCLIYRVPGNESGFLKIKTVDTIEKCSNHIFTKGDSEWPDVKGLQFAIYSDRISVNVTLPGFKNEKWQVPLFNVFEKPLPKMQLSSAEYRSPKMHFLIPNYDGPASSAPKKVSLKKDQPCHTVNDDCSSVGQITCNQCPEGWYEVPNGCSQGPKFCGRLDCGKKNHPACRRGIKWQRVDKKFECRGDDSFAFCAKGLKVQCIGNLPYCI